MAQDGDMKWSLISLTATFLVFALLSVVFRFWARYTTAANVGADDWLILAGLASQDCFSSSQVGTICVNARLTQFVNSWCLLPLVDSIHPVSFLPPLDLSILPK